MNTPNKHTPLNVNNINEWEVTMSTEFYERELKRLEAVSKKMELTHAQQFGPSAQRLKQDMERIECLTKLLTSTIQDEMGPLFSEGKQRPVFNEDEARQLRHRVLEIAMRM